MEDKNEGYKVKVNEFEFSFSTQQMAAFDVIRKSPHEFNLLKEHLSLNAVLTEFDSSRKKVSMEMEGETFHIEIKDELDQMLENMGFNKASNKQIKEVKAPMPGLVLEIAVSVGQEVVAGDKILILEAMKMENSIMIHANAVIKRIAVVAGQAVEKGQLLVELE